jgi:hypothetical protein
MFTGRQLLGFERTPFLGTGVISDLFHRLGTVDSLIDRFIKTATAGDKASAHALNKTGGKLSIPGALLQSK